MAEAALAEEREAYEEMRPELEARASGKWALVRGKELIGTYEEFQSAATEAVRRFGRGPYLIREIGTPDITLPASVVYSTVEDA